MIEERYIRKFTEMPISYAKLEQKLNSNFTVIMEHFLKYKLTDRDFSSKIDKDLYSKVYSYREYWKKDIQIKVKIFWTDLKNYVITGKHNDRKEKAYLEILVDMKSEISSKFEDIILETVSKQSDSYKLQLKNSLRNYMIYNEFGPDSDWFKEFYNFFLEIKPNKSKLLPLEEVFSILSKYI